MVDHGPTDSVAGDQKMKQGGQARPAGDGAALKEERADAGLFSFYP
jgi:hypothetical protein